jgi:hypothetical protein
MINKIKTKAEVIFIRFLRGFVYGFASSASTMGIFSGASLSDLQVWIGLLLISGVAGGITGGLLAVDKYFRWKEDTGFQVSPKIEDKNSTRGNC